jgi:NADPH2:quinone reductase
MTAIVIATASTPHKAELAREAGADEIIIYTHSKFEEEVMRITKGIGLEGRLLRSRPSYI